MSLLILFAGATTEEQPSPVARGENRAEMAFRDKRGVMLFRDKRGNIPFRDKRAFGKES